MDVVALGLAKADAAKKYLAKTALRALVGGAQTAAPNAQSAVTVGRPNVVIDDTAYNGLGGIARTASGTLVATWRAGTNHDTSNGVIKLSTSTDGGQTWTAPATVLTVAGVDLRDACIAILADGTWLISYFHYDGTNPTGVYVIRSTDSGVTWSAEVAVAHGYTTSAVATSMHPVQLADGTVVIAMYGLDTGSIFNSVRLSRSSNSGLTWTAGALVANGTADSQQYQEPTLTVLNDGRLLCLIRQGSTQTQKVYSSDGGATWGAVSTAFTNSNGRPAAIQSAAGPLVCIYRQQDVNGAQAVYRVSLDSGTTWTAEKPLANSYGSSQYADLCEVSRGVLGVSLGTEGSASTVSRITFRYLIVSPQPSPIGDQGAPGAAVTVGARLFGLRAYDALARPDRAAMNGSLSDSGHEYVSFGGTSQLLAGEIAYSSGTALLAVLTRGVTDGRFRVPVKWTGTNSGIGLMVRLVDSSNYLLFNIEGGGSTLKLYKADTGVLTVLVTATTPPALRPDVFHEIEVNFKSDRIKVLIEGDKVIDYTLTTAELTKYGAAFRHGFRSSHASHRFGPWSLTG